MESPAVPDTEPASQGPEDWAWVEEWRRSDEPAPWSVGLVLTVFTAVVVGCAVYVMCDGLRDKPIIDVVVNLVVAGGLAPAAWMARSLPVLRWVSLGAGLGIVVAWIGALWVLAG